MSECKINNDSCSVKDAISMFTEDSCGQKWCVRRLGGIFGMASVITCIFLQIEHESLNTLLLLSASLLGITTVDKFIKK